MSRLALALAVEGVALLVVFASFFAGEARHAALGVGGVLLVAAALGGVAAGKAGARKGFWLWYASLAAYAFLYIPLAIVIAFSFNDSKLNAEWVGFTLAWYLRLAQDEAMLIAAGHSLLIAAVASAVATLLGTLAGMAMHARRLRLMPLLVFAPVAMPEILLGVSLLIFFLNVAQPALAAVGVDFRLGLISVIIAHITFSISFVAIVVRARLAGADESIFEAARDLGATPWQTFRLVTLPLILPGIVAGALMAFALSLDDFVITFFTAGVGTKTLPLEIYTLIKVAVTPEVNAVSALLLLLTLATIAVAGRIAPEALRSHA